MQNQIDEQLQKLLRNGDDFEDLIKKTFQWNAKQIEPVAEHDLVLSVENFWAKVSGWREPMPECPEQEEETGCIFLDTVKSEKVSWLWHGYIPIGKITLLDGDPGLGKSLFTTDAAARITTGQPMPDGSPSIQGGAVLMSLEDGLSDTVVPRLEVAMADKSKIVALQGVKDGDGNFRFPTVEDTGAIEKACESVDAKLVVIDPLMGYMGSGFNSWRDQDVRRALSPLAKMAGDVGAAVIIVRHLNKTSSSNSIYRGGGSIGIIGAARSALLIAKDPEDENRRILAGIKSNLATLPSSLSYEIENVDGVPKIVWGGITSHTANGLLAIPSNPEDRSALDDAKDFLSDVLSGGGVDSKEIQRQARQAGIAEKTLQRGKKVLGIISTRLSYGFGKGGGWEWILPQDGQDTHKVVIKNDDHVVEGLTILCESKPPDGEIIDLTNGVTPLDDLEDAEAGGVLEDVMQTYGTGLWTQDELESNINRLVDMGMLRYRDNGKG